MTGGKEAETAFDPNPDLVDQMPVRPYRVLHADLPFYSDPECRTGVVGARLIMLRCEDPRQKFHPIEAMPVRRRYQEGQIVRWEINNKAMWEISWFINPENGQKEKAWTLATEFVGPVVNAKSVAD